MGAAPGAPLATSSMMAMGCSLRGLSDVMITTSARVLATFPITGRLARSLSPPAPNTMTTRPGPSAGDRPVISRAAFNASPRAAGVWAKSTRTWNGWPSSTS